MDAQTMIQPLRIDAWLAQFQDIECKTNDTIVGITCWYTFG